MNIFTMDGGESDKDTSAEAGFYTTYTNSDFLKYFGLIRDDLVGNGSPTSLTLTCKGLLKLLPYDGFYPAQRTVDMAAMFSSSYGNFINYTLGAGLDSRQGFRTYMAPMFAPGTMYNTIKSGIAVDYPIFTGSYHTLDISEDEAGSTTYLSGATDGIAKFGARIPFEALVEPAPYLTSIDIVDMETHPSAALNATASWDGSGGNLYEMMANNFLAESIDFFLPEGKLTTIASRPEDQWESAEEGKVYAARVKLRKSYNQPLVRTGSQAYQGPLTPATLWRSDTFHSTFDMYSRPSAFGPPCGWRQRWDNTLRIYKWFQSLLYSSVLLWGSLGRYILDI